MTADESWMLDDVTWVKGVRHVVVLTSDGLVKAMSDGTGRDVAERLAAACAGLRSLGQSLAGEFGSATASRQVVVEFEDKGGFLFVRGAGDGSHLAVITEHVVDPALIAQQMQIQVNKIGERNLGTPARPSG